MSAAPAARRTFDRSLVEGPLGPAVWRLAWPTMLQNVVAGLQGIIDHTMVGHMVGFAGNAAIGVSWQVMLVVIVFISSLFTGMGVLVARFAGGFRILDPADPAAYTTCFTSGYGTASTPSKCSYPTQTITP